MHTPQYCGIEYPSSQASSSEKHALLTKELYGDDYGPSFLGTTEHAHAVDIRPSFLHPLFLHAQEGTPEDEANYL